MTRLDRIRQHIRITDLLSELGYNVQPVEREQQFGCDLHGTRDGKPSARVYPDSNSWYCFACGKSRDVIGTVMDKMELDFKKAMTWLEQTYKLPSWSGPDRVQTASLSDDLNATFAENRNTGDVTIQVRTLLQSQRHDKALSCQTVMHLWERFDEAASIAEKSPELAAKAMLSLRDAVVKEVQDAARLS